MTPEQINAYGVLVTAAGSLVTATGIAIVGVITVMQRNIIKEIEKQGNSTSLELKRTNMVFSRRVAVATGDPGDVALAKESETIHDEAVKQIELAKA